MHRIGSCSALRVLFVGLVVALGTCCDAQLQAGLTAGYRYCSLKESGSEWITGGTHGTTPYWSDYEQRSTGFGPMIGAFCTFFGDAKLACSVEVLFGNRSTGTSHENIFGSTFDTTWNIALIEVPLSVKLRLAKGFRLGLGGGPVFISSYDYHAKAVIHYTTQGVPMTEVSEEHVTSKAGMAAIAVDVHVGLSYQMKNGLVIQARYLYDATDLNNDPLVNDRFGMVELSVGYTLFGKRTEP